MDIPILYEDENILALDKPAGMSVHGDGVNKEKTIADWLLEKFPGLSAVGEDLIKDGIAIKKPGLVHRLDKETSGVLLVAKNQPAYVQLKKQFQDRQIAKTYRLLVYGVFGEGKKEGTINLPIGRSRKDPRKRLAGRSASSVLREAVTHYRVLEDFDGYSYVEAHPKTGRTHQLRVHFKAINHPIVCDSLYAQGRSCLPGLDRQALHCFALEFAYEKRRIRIEAPLPGDFVSALDNLKTLC